MKQLNLVIIIPAFNEEATIGVLIKKIPKKINGIGTVKTIVIDDGSTDNTANVALKAGASKIVKLHTNKGLGIAFRKGIKTALEMKADIVVNIDADLQFDPNEIPKLVGPILLDKADFVTCSRFLDKKLQPKLPFLKKFGNSLFTKIVNFLTSKNFTDTQCGFRAYGKEACLRLNIFGKHTYTQEVFLALEEHDLRIVEVPCNVKAERKGKSKVVSNVFVYGLKAILIILRFIRDYKPLAFFGSIGVGILSLGIAIATAMFFRWIITGQTSPLTSLIPITGIIIILGFLMLMLAFLADMNDRQRKTQEEILYRLKKQELEK